MNYLKVKEDIETETPLGIYDVPFKEYAKINYHNQSTIKYYSESPAHYHFFKSYRKKPTVAMLEGRIWHKAILEPNKFFEEYALQPKINRTTKTGKAEEAQWFIDNPGREPVRQDLFRQMVTAQEQIHSNPSLAPFFENGLAETSFFTQDSYLGLRKKGMLDYWHPAKNIIIDLKTTTSCDEFKFGRDIEQLLYHVQAAWYCDLVKEATGEKIDGYGILALEKNPPFACRMFTLPDKVIEKGRKMYTRYLSIHKECEKVGKWPTFDNLVVDFEPKSWFYESQLPEYPIF